MKKILQIFLVSYVVITILVFVSHMVFYFSTKRIHPISNYALEKVMIDGVDTYHFTLVELTWDCFEPSILSGEGLSGIYLSGTDLYLRLGSVYYYVNLKGGMIKQINDIPSNVHFIEPKDFWEAL